MLPLIDARIDADCSLLSLDDANKLVTLSTSKSHGLRAELQADSKTPRKMHNI